MIAMLGLSDAGKSTWLGSLLDGLDGVPGPLQLNACRTGYTRVAQYCEALLEGRYPEHTPIPAHEPNRFDLVWQGAPVTLNLSDYSGERLGQLHRRDSHSWDDGWKERADCRRLVILLRADKLVRTDWRPSPLAGEPVDTDLVPDLRPEPGRHPPTALALVEALQAMWAWRGRSLGHCVGPGEERVAVVLSAWDTQPQDTSPRDFLGDNAPLLDSWLHTNLHPADIEVFGLSATGGDLKYPETAERVRREGLRAVAWCSVGSPAARHHDVSLPLQWLLEP